MICFEIYINKKKVSKAGIKDDLGILTNIISLVKRNRDDKKSEKVEIVLGGLKGSTDEHLEWLREELKVDDEITIKIISDNKCDKPIKKYRDNPQSILEAKMKYFHQLKDELKDHLCQ
jgi:hypothetical protein